MKPLSMLSLISTQMGAIRSTLNSLNFAELFPPHLDRMMFAPFYPAFSVYSCGEQVGTLSMGSGMEMLSALRAGASGAYATNASFRPGDTDAVNKLWEFRNIEIWGIGTIKTVKQLAERLLRRIIVRLEQTALLPRNRINALRVVVKSPIRSTTSGEAHELTRANMDRDLSLLQKLDLCRACGNRPVFVTGIDQDVNPHFVDFRVDSNGVTHSFDLCAPFAGEIMGGGQLETNSNRLRRQFSSSRFRIELENKGSSLRAAEQYLSALTKIRKPVFRLNVGFERVTQYLLGFPRIASATAFPITQHFVKGVGIARAAG